MKMNSKKIMALMGCAMLVMGMLAGCKSSAGEPATAASTTAEGAAATTGAPAGTSEAAGTSAEDGSGAAADLSGSISMVGPPPWRNSPMH